MSHAAPLTSVARRPVLRQESDPQRTVIGQDHLGNAIGISFVRGESGPNAAVIEANRLGWEGKWLEGMAHTYAKSPEGAWEQMIEIRWTDHNSREPEPADA